MTAAERSDTLIRNRALLRDLLANEGYRTLLLPFFQERAVFHAKKCRDRTMAAEKRAEHIEAADLAESLTGYLESRLADVEAKIKKGEK